MQRDWDLIRALMLRAENLETDKKLDEAFDRWDEKTVKEHLRLMYEKGLIDAVVSAYGNTIGRVVVNRVTWEGHDFLAAIKNETIWKQVTGHVKKTVGEVTIDVLKSLLQDAMKLAVTASVAVAAAAR